MTVRLQKLIAARGLASRRAAETWITEGRVTVDGVTAALGDSADPDTQIVAVDGIPLPPPEEAYTYIVLYKPRGVVTTRSDEQGRRTVMDLLPPDYKHLTPVGRLDITSEGLLLLTDDGDAVFALTHPSHQVEKTYIAWVRPGDDQPGVTVESALAVLRRPMRLDGGQSVMGAKVRMISPDILSLTIREGKNRQVRRMCQAAGLHVTRLKRAGEGGIELGDIGSGQYRALTETEIAYIRDIKARGKRTERLL